MVKISVIVPTLNEEKQIAKCLQSLKNQTFRDFEVIVADTHSKDRTAEIAKKYGAKVVLTKRKGPGAGRNSGAEAAKGSIFVFLNADAEASRNVLKSIDKKISEGVAGGICSFYPTDGRFKDRAFFKVGNWVSRASMRMSFKYAPAECLFVRKNIFDKIGGFREDMEFNEDNDFSRACSRIGRFVYLKSRVNISLRRYHKYGYRKTMKTYIKPTLHYARKKEVPSSKFKLEAIR